MAGSKNDTQYSSGYNLTPITADSTSVLQQETTAVQFVNVSGNPEGVQSANVGSIALDRGSGTVYSKTSGTGNTGWTALGGGGGLSVGTKITTYDASDTWTKSVSPPTVYIEVIGFNGGGGGASGRKGATTASGGGGAGSGGGGFYINAPASFFDTTETVTIGGTSNGGAAQATDLTNGNPGSAGNACSFGNITGVSAFPSVGGTTTSAAAGTARMLTNFMANVSISSPATGTNVSATTTAPSIGNLTYFSGTVGGGGAGYDAVTPRTGAAGFGVYKGDFTTLIIAGGTGGSEAGTINGGAGNPGTSGATAHGIMSGGTGGGGGGGPSAGTVAGNGGNGGIPGGGGGGGSGGISGVASSGAGGTGARGRVIVIEHF